MATAIAVVLILFFAAIKKNKSHVWKIFLSILLSSLTVVILGNMMVELVLTRVHIDSNIENRSVSERVVQYQEANNLIEKRPFTGVGIGNYISVLINERQTKGDWYSYQPVHNTFMLVWAELGIFGFMAILGLLYYLFMHRNKLAYQNSLLIVLLILLIFDHWLWSFHFGILFFWLILGTVAIRK
jgi:O-antigen ligase